MTTDHEWRMCACERAIPAHTDTAPDPAGGHGCGMARRTTGQPGSEIEERPSTDITDGEGRPGPRPHHPRGQMIRNVVAALAITLGIGLTATPADAAEPAKGNPPVEGPVIGKSHRTHRITPQGPVPDECRKLEIGGPEDHWFYGGTEICVNKRTWRNTPLGVWFSGPYLRLAEEGPLAKPVAAALTEPQSIEVQPGGHLRQDAPAGLDLPNHHISSEENQMVGPHVAVGGGRP